MLRSASRLIPVLVFLASTSSWAGSEPVKDVWIRIEKRQLVDSEETIRFSQGNRVNLHWSSDETTELHLHGYDLTLTLSAGETGMMTLHATVPGRFPVSVHGFSGEHDHHTLMYVEIYPD